MDAFFLKLSIMLVPGLLAVTCHEVAHGFVADRCGDPTARLLGRLSLNPLRHLDLIGTLALLLLGFGWARAVPVNPGNLRRTRGDMVLVALAGPGANLLLALFWALCLRWGATAAGSLPPDNGTLAVAEPVALMAAFGLYINVILTLFNLLPIPPLDGGRVLMNLLPERLAEGLRRIEPFGLVVIVVLVFATPLWQRFFAPLVLRVVDLLAGQYSAVVMHTVQLMFSR